MVKAPLRKIHQFAQGSQQCRILVLYEITDHNGFAAAEGKVRERIFVGHVCGRGEVRLRAHWRRRYSFTFGIH